MEFQETLLKFTCPEDKKKNPKPSHKWKKLSFHRSPPSPPKPSNFTVAVPKEFLCPISGSLMADPVIVSSGHTFERACVRACRNLNYTPSLHDGAVPDFSTVIPNLALKSTILNWYSANKRGEEVASLPMDVPNAERLIRERMEREELLCRLDDRPSVGMHRAATEPARRAPPSDSGESADSPLQLATRPSCFSHAVETAEEAIQEWEPELLAKLESLQAYDVEEALASLRNTTRTRVEERAFLCTARVLSVLKTLVASRYVNIQVNAVASLVNLSLEKANKVKIVRCGVVPYLIDVLKCGFPEAQDHASGALFSLALDDYNKTAIGVLGALPPLLHLLRSSESETARNDSALALYHLSFVRSNRSKLIKLGSIPVLLGMVGPERIASRVVLLLGNLAASEDGRAAILDSGGVARLVGVLERDELVKESTREGCVSILWGLSHGGLRFRGLAKAAGAAEVLVRVGSQGSERCSGMVSRILEVIKGPIEESKEESSIDWEKLLYSGGFQSSSVPHPPSSNMPTNRPCADSSSLPSRYHPGELRSLDSLGKVCSAQPQSVSGSRDRSPDRVWRQSSAISPLRNFETRKPADVPRYGRYISSEAPDASMLTTSASPTPMSPAVGIVSRVPPANGILQKAPSLVEEHTTVAGF